MYDCLSHAIDEDSKSFSVDLVPNSALIHNEFDFSDRLDFIGNDVLHYFTYKLVFS